MQKTFMALFFMLILSACNPEVAITEPRIVDRSFINDQPCSAPCWYGLTPGKSSLKEILSELKELPFIDQNSIKMNESGNNTNITYGCVETKSDICGSLVVSEDQLLTISQYVKYPLVLKEVIDKLGPPEYLEVTPYPPHGDGCIVMMDWFSKMIEIVVIDRPNFELCQSIIEFKKIDPGLQVDVIHYSLEKILKAYTPCDGKNCPSWPGLK